MAEFAYADWPDDFSYVAVAEMTRRVAYIPNGRRAALFITLTDGQKICLTLPLDELNAAVAQINADPATRIAVIDGGKE